MRLHEAPKRLVVVKILCETFAYKNNNNNITALTYILGGNEWNSAFNDVSVPNSGNLQTAYVKRERKCAK